MPSSSSTVVVAEDDGAFQRPPSVMISGDVSALDNSTTQTFAFSSGNPRIEETRGVMHLFSSSSNNRNLPKLVGCQEMGEEVLKSVETQVSAAV